jgi:hypothetical protein
MSELQSVNSSFADLEQPYDFQNVPRYRGGNRVTRNKLNPVAAKPAVPRPVVSKPRMPAARSARGGPVSKALPTIAGTKPGDASYWHMLVAAALVLWVIYAAAHNELGTWAKILFWSPAAPVQVGPASTTGSDAAAKTAGDAIAGGVKTGADQAAALGLPSWLGGLSGGGQSAAGVIPSIMQLIPSAISGAGGGVPGTGGLNGPRTGAVPGVTSSPQTPFGSGPGGMLGSQFWNGWAGQLLQKYGGYGK